MRLFTEWSRLPPDRHVLTIGNFDGVHRGHRSLLTTVRDRARALGVRSLAITFDPLPSEVLVPERAPQRLTLTEHRLRLLLACGIDRILLVRFDRSFAALSPEEFVRLLVNSAHPVEIVVGDDFHFGRNRSGNPDVLRALGTHYGFGVTIIERVAEKTGTISSTRIREAIARGDVRLAAELLDRPHLVVGDVVKGSGRGTLLGFPTANIAIRDRLLPPADGIYASIVHALERWYPALAYLGNRPTFPGAGYAVEVYLLADAVPALQGTVLDVYFIERLRPDRAFADPDQLIRQMQEDERHGRARLAMELPTWPPPLVAALYSPLEGEPTTYGHPERA
ncbi:riboflavin biosynthesis protein RibF [Thermomicrobium sp. 4228-Ro]|uniref:riboflavin biosynthesis protein RibF n=1 Tax=Thermomicrobium sp. 4228-Ro TaxID=2993937 RepID=UPI00224948A4|nr:riboflavin biosynthesis protein RibF [Thermomicrobium sp. 4228-Ro]MCX2726140.1 riboflavin biosynthesis protein RibF [Thermomicrobium sp. 4228-Ro]